MHISYTLPLKGHGAVYQSIYLSITLYVYQSIYLSITLYVYTNLSIYLSLFMCTPIYLSVYHSYVHVYTGYISTYCTCIYRVHKHILYMYIQGT